MLELYDQEEIMRVQDKRNSVIMNVVIALREVGFSFSEVVNKLAKQFCLSKEIAEKEVQEYLGKQFFKDRTEVVMCTKPELQIVLEKVKNASYSFTETG